MRVIAGQARGMRLECPPGDDVRPLPDMVREALFNILRDQVEGAAFLDLFAGAGTVGIEALSRGAARCVFVERSPKTREFLEKNLVHTRLSELSDVLQRDAFRCIAALQTLERKFDIVFVGPPFPLWLEASSREAVFDLVENIAAAGLLNDHALVIFQHELKTAMRDPIAGFQTTDSRRYGRNCLRFITYASATGLVE